MDLAKEYQKKGFPQGTVIVAQAQSMGRGQRHKKWVSPKGGLYFSVIIRPNIGPGDVPKILLAALMAITTVLKDNYKLNASIKWPNDIHLEGKKISGALMESEIKRNKVESVILGAGINVNITKNQLANVDIKCTSMYIELKKRILIKGLLKSILKQFFLNYRSIDAK